MCLPSWEPEEFELCVDGSSRALLPVKKREDVAVSYPRLGVLKCGFEARVPVSGLGVTDWVQIEVFGRQDRVRRGRMELVFCDGWATAMPSPPKALMTRVANIGESARFALSGMKSYGELLDELNRHVAVESVDRLLDFGCGCGRLLYYLVNCSGILGVSGCDIDAEAIEWVRSRISGVHVSVTPHLPPTSYDDSAFEVILASSVFSHLSREAQLVWLKELRRILKPDGVLIASIHGEFAASASLAPNNQSALSEKGILDASLDASLDGIAPAGYYRSTFQTESYTRSEWGRFLRVVAIRERGMHNWQDLVVLRKEGDK